MAYIPRVFLENATQPAQLPETVVITDPFYVEHLTTVLRLRTGQCVDVVINRNCYEGEWVSGNKTSVTIRLTSLQHLPVDALPEVSIAIALLPDERWRWMLQKTTELGVRRIFPLLSERSKIKIQDVNAKQARWQAIATAAACQSEGLFIPTVTPPLTVADLLKQTKFCNRKILLLERSEGRQPLIHWLEGATSQESVLLVIGPEAGWSESEVETFRQNNFQLASLGQRILRSETAAIAAMTSVLVLTTPAD